MERRRFLKYCLLAPVALKLSKFDFKNTDELYIKRLGKDLATFHNMDIGTVHEKLTKAWLGETEALASLGINIKSICTKRILKEVENENI